MFLSSLVSIQNPGLKSIKDSPTLKQPIQELLEIKSDDKPEFVEFTITFVLKVKVEELAGDDQILKNIPTIRVIF